jgi:hypothetical protein
MAARPMTPAPRSPQTARQGNPASGRAALAATRGGGQGTPASAARRAQAGGGRRRPRMTPGAAQSGRGALLIRGKAGEHVQDGAALTGRRGYPDPDSCHYSHHYHQKNHSYHYQHQENLARQLNTARERQQMLPGGEAGHADGPGCPAPSARGGPALPAISTIGRQKMIMLYAVLGYAALAAVIVFLIYRLTRTKEDLVTARRTAAHAQARQEAARQAAQAARQRCRSALRQAEQSLAQTGQALEIAGHIKLVSQQVNGLIEYITGPFEEPVAASPSEEPLPLGYRPGRHALPAGAGDRDLNDDAQTQMEFIP